MHVERKFVAYCRNCDKMDLKCRMHKVHTASGIQYYCMTCHNRVKK